MTEIVQFRRIDRVVIDETRGTVDEFENDFGSTIYDGDRIRSCIVGVPTEVWKLVGELACRTVVIGRADEMDKVVESHEECYFSFPFLRIGLDSYRLRRKETSCGRVLIEEGSCDLVVDVH